VRTTAADQRACSIALDAARDIGSAKDCAASIRYGSPRRIRQPERCRGARAAKSLEAQGRGDRVQADVEGFGVTAGSRQKFAQGCRDNCWIKDHLPSHAAQTASLRAVKAILQCAFGKRGRPRFKRKADDASLEGRVGRIHRPVEGRRRWCFRPGDP
jgi:putative transposase